MHPVAHLDVVDRVDERRHLPEYASVQDGGGQHHHADEDALQGRARHHVAVADGEGGGHGPVERGDVVVRVEVAGVAFPVAIEIFELRVLVVVAVVVVIIHRFNRDIPAITTRPPHRIRTRIQ